MDRLRSWRADRGDSPGSKNQRRSEDQEKTIYLLNSLSPLSLLPFDCTKSGSYFPTPTDCPRWRRFADEAYQEAGDQSDESHADDEEAGAAFE